MIVTSEAISSSVSDVPAEISTQAGKAGASAVTLALPAGIDVPIIMVTGNNDTASIARAYEVGATDFISKPVLWATLPQRIEFI